MAYALEVLYRLWTGAWSVRFQIEPDGCMGSLNDWTRTGDCQFNEWRGHALPHTAELARGGAGMLFKLFAEGKIVGISQGKCQFPQGKLGMH